MGKQQSKPKGQYLRELHRKVPNMNMDEIKAIYDDFIRQSGGRNMLRKKDFVKVYNKAFGKCGENKLAENIFNSFDTDRSGYVDFEEFLIGLSITENTDMVDRTSRMKKLKWAFSVYDKDTNNTIDREEMRLIVKAVSDLIPDNEFLKGQSADDYADKLFDSVDTDGSGDITFEEFVKAAEKDETLLELILPNPQV